MFENIFSFGLQRTTKQAWGFYLGHLAILIFSGFILGFVYGITQQGSAFNSGISVGVVIAVVYVAVISFFMLKQKGMARKFKYIILALCGVALSAGGGGVLGLIIPAVLSTKPSLISASPASPVVL